MKGSNHCRFSDASYEAFLNCGSCCDTQRMTIETTFPEKVTSSQEADDCLFASLRNDSELNLSFLDIENRIRNIALSEDNL